MKLKLTELAADEELFNILSQGFPGMIDWWSLAKQYFHKDFVAEVAATEPIIPITYDPSTGKFIQMLPKDGKWFD